jgi:hypothetical protein
MSLYFFNYETAVGAVGIEVLLHIPFYLILILAQI